MTSLLVLAGVILGYNFHFWMLLFLAVAVCRYNVNRNIKILFTGIFLNVGLFLLVFYVPSDMYLISKYYFRFIIFSQCAVAIYDIIYNIRKKYWRKDYVFFFMEPYLIALLFYFFTSGYDVIYLYTALQNWVTIYIITQIVYLILKYSVLIKPDLIPSLAVAGQGVVPRQPQEVVRDELNLLLARTKAVVTFDYHKVRQLNKELAKHRENHYILNRSGTRNGNGHAAKKAATAASNGKNGNRTASPKNGTPKDSGYDDDTGKDMRRAE